MILNHFFHILHLHSFGLMFYGRKVFVKLPSLVRLYSFHLRNLSIVNDRNLLLQNINCKKSFCLKIEKRYITQSSFAMDQLSDTFMEKQIYPPIVVRGMKTLDYDLFRKKVSVPYVRTKTENIEKIRKILKPHFLKISAFNPVQRCIEDDTIFHIYLNPDKFVDVVTDKITELKSDLINNESTNDFVQYRSHELTYENFNYHQILRSILPDKIDTVSGFSTIGHIIHLNLREEALPFKQVIGQVSTKLNLLTF